MTFQLLPYIVDIVDIVMSTILLTMCHLIFTWAEVISPRTLKGTTERFKIGRNVMHRWKILII